MKKIDFDKIKDNRNGQQPDTGAAGVDKINGNFDKVNIGFGDMSSIVGLDTYPVFSDTKTYVKGEIVNYGGLLYEFTADHEAGAWIGEDAEKTNLKENILSANESFTNNTNLNRYIDGLYLYDCTTSKYDRWKLDIGYDYDIGWFFIIYKNDTIWANWYSERDLGSVEVKPTQPIIQLIPYSKSDNKDDIILLHINQIEYSLLQNIYTNISGDIYIDKATSLNHNYNIIYYLNNVVSLSMTVNDYVLELYCDESYYEYFNKEDKPVLFVGCSNDLGYYISINIYDGSSSEGKFVKYFSLKANDISTLTDSFIELDKSDGPTFYAVINLDKFKTISIGKQYRGYVQINKLLKPVCNPIITSQLRLNKEKEDSKKYQIAANEIRTVEFKYGGYINFKGNFTEFTSQIYTICYTDYYPISPDINYFYTGVEYQEVTSWALYDKDKKYISSSSTSIITEAIEYENEPIKNIPPNAKYIRFSCYYKNVKRFPRVCVRSLSNNLPWFNKKWCVFGDSLTEYNSRTNIHYFDYIAEVSGLKIYNCGLSGSGYKELEDENKAFYQRISNIDTDFDIITIFGSGNDTRAGEIGQPNDTSTDTICGCVNKTLDNLFAINPTAIVGIVTPVLWPNRTALDDNTFMVDYSNALVKICKLRSIPCLDLSKCSLMRPNDIEFRKLCYSKDDGDGVHPNELGHKILAPRFYNFLQSLML